MRSAVIWAIRFYRLAISPLKPPCCRFIPTCSEYALEAVGRFGVLRGGLLAVWRLLRCHPFARGGYDPVPLAPWPRLRAPLVASLRRRTHSNRWDLNTNGKQASHNCCGALPRHRGGLELPVPPGQAPSP